MLLSPFLNTYAAPSGMLNVGDYAGCLDSGFALAGGLTIDRRCAGAQGNAGPCWLLPALQDSWAVDGHLGALRGYSNPCTWP